MMLWLNVIIDNEDESLNAFKEKFVMNNRVTIMPMGIALTINFLILDDDDDEDDDLPILRKDDDLFHLPPFRLEVDINLIMIVRYYLSPGETTCIRTVYAK